MENIKSVHQLRKDGYQIRILHYRVSNDKPLNEFNLVHSSLVSGDQVYSHGGLTIAQVKHKDGRETEGQARCSIKDNFNRKLGVKIALNRAFINAEKGEFVTISPTPNPEEFITGNLPKSIYQPLAV
jgi:hypothetical protein